MTYTQLILSTFLWLIWRDIRVMGKNFIANLIDSIMLPIGWILINGYIMPHLGVPDYYGTFMLAGTAAGMCFNTTGTDTGILVNDLEGPKSISYELSLPITSWLLCIKTALVYALKAMIANIFIFPVGVMLLWQKINLHQISWGKLALIYVLMNLLYGFFSLVIALWVKNAEEHGRFWLRWGWLIFIIAGLQFSWASMKQAAPAFAYINLLNPLLYPHEGMRAALLGQEGSLNYWFCLLMISIFTILFAFIALKLFKKRLDCV